MLASGQQGYCIFQDAAQYYFFFKNCCACIRKWEPGYQDLSNQAEEHACFFPHMNTLGLVTGEEKKSIISEEGNLDVISHAMLGINYIFFISANVGKSLK